MRKLVYIINVDWYFALHWLERAKASVNNGYEVYVITSFSSKKIVDSIKAEGLNIINVKISRKGLNPLIELLTIISLSKLLNNIKPDLVHTITVKCNLYGSLICRIKKIPFICSVTGLGYAFSSTSVKARVIKYFIQSFYKVIARAKQYRILFENNDDMDYMVENNIIPAGNVKRISGAGVDCDLYKYVAEPESDTIKILCAARMLYDKGIHLLVEASSELKKTGLDFEILIAGILDKGNPGAIPEQKLVQWDRQGLSNWLGQVENMPELLQNIHIAVLPTSYGEGIPRFLIEAAASGRPAITTNVAGCREIIENDINGFLIDVGDKYQLATALNDLISSKQMRLRMGRAGREKVLNEYSQDKVIAQTMEIYNSVLG